MNRAFELLLKLTIAKKTNSSESSEVVTATGMDDHQPEKAA